MAADNLKLRDDGKLPETFAKVRILPKMYVKPKPKKKTNPTTEAIFSTSKPYVPKWLMLTFRVCNTSHAIHHTTTHSLFLSISISLSRIFFPLSFIDPKHKHKQTHAPHHQMHTHSTKTHITHNTQTYTITLTFNRDTNSRAHSCRCYRIIQNFIDANANEQNIKQPKRCSRFDRGTILGEVHLFTCPVLSFLQ